MERNTLRANARTLSLAAAVFMLMALGGCATATLTPASRPAGSRVHSMSMKEQFAVGLWRIGSFVSPERYDVMLRRSDGTYVRKYTHVDGTPDGLLEKRTSGRWRISGNYFVYTLDEHAGPDPGKSFSRKGKSGFKYEIYKISSRGFGTISTDGAICMELRVPPPQSAASPDDAFEKTRLIDKAAGAAVLTNDIQSDASLRF
jgi:hypothetical protein